MTPFDVAALLVVLAAVLGFCNHHLLKLPHTIGLTVMGAVASLGVLGLDAALPAAGLGESVRGFLANIDFPYAMNDDHFDNPIVLNRLYSNLF